jgi:hypothetical protein
MKIVYSTLEDAHSKRAIQDANIPKHAAIFVQIGDALFALGEKDGHLTIHVEKQIVVLSGVNNSIRIREEPYSFDARPTEFRSPDQG